MASAANLGVDDAENKLRYDIPSSVLKGLKERNFSFTIEDRGDGTSQACFRITDENSQVIRENLSKPFPTGTIQKKSAMLKKDGYVVKLKKQAGIKLDDYF